MIRHFLHRWTFPRQRRPTARTRSAGSIHCIKSLSTRRGKIALLHKAKGGMIASNLVMEDRPSLFSTRRQKPQRRLCWGSNARVASTYPSTQSRGASTLRLVETRRGRGHLCSNCLFFLFFWSALVWLTKSNFWRFCSIWIECVFVLAQNADVFCVCTSLWYQCIIASSFMLQIKWNPQHLFVVVACSISFLMTVVSCLWWSKAYLAPNLR